MKAKRSENLRAYYVALAALYKDIKGDKFCPVSFRHMSERYRIPFHTDDEIRAAIDWACFVELEKVESKQAVDYLRSAMDIERVYTPAD